MKIIEKLIEAGVDNESLSARNCEGTARKYYVCAGRTEDFGPDHRRDGGSGDREILYLLRGLGCRRLIRQRGDDASGKVS